MPSTPSRPRVVPPRIRGVLAAAITILTVACGQYLAAQGVAVPAPAGFGMLQGSVMDSIHNTPLVNAGVLIEGTARSALTDKDGHYRIDSIPAGLHRVMVLHPLLDTIGLQMQTPSYAFKAGESHDLDIAVPSGSNLVRALCAPARIALGPGIMLGFVRDPDTKLPARGARVELVYYESDPIGRKMARVRNDTVDSLGLYRICGIPADMSGKVQVFRNGVSSGEVPVESVNGVALRAFSIVAKQQAIAEVKNDSGRVRHVAIGRARVTGKVVDRLGKPLSGARVALQGGGKVAITRPNGDFVLDSLPSGTQAIQARKLGYAATEIAVELSANEVQHTTISMGDFVPTLATMRVEAAQDKALSDVGYLQRKQTGLGFYLDGNMINHESLAFSDVMRVAPGLRVSPLGDGRTNVITDARSATNGCVNYYVDGFPYTTMTAGDVDDFVRPQEIVAVEVYHGSSTPPQFTTAGQSSCATIVVWTIAKVRPSNKRRSP